jgi:ribosome-associated heat shock protein Hsp15
MDENRVRLDSFLDFACLFKTRSQAKRALELGRVLVNGQRAKGSSPIHPGDTLTLQQEYGQRIVKVVAVLDRHVPKAKAREAYEDLTPPPSEETLEHRKMDRMLKKMWTPEGRPEKGDRRKLRKIKGRE